MGEENHAFAGIDVLGTATSQGCIRLDTQAITWLATRIEPGAPVTITR
jgi:lipoprotein-anchoring transpeptidase ErfK/SrfK